MRIALIGEGEFGKAVLEAFLARGDTVAAVIGAPDEPGVAPDALLKAAQDGGVQVLRFSSLAGAEPEAALRALDAEIGIMAGARGIVPRALLDAPRHGTIHCHPSLLPRYRGPSPIPWPIAKGDTGTGLTILRPTEGLDEGPVILQRTCAIGPRDTAADVFDTLLPIGVEALLEAADLVVRGDHLEIEQDEDAATYDGPFGQAQARIQWTAHAEIVHNLIRAANPDPGAWTLYGGRRLAILAVRFHPVHRAADAAGRAGEVVALDEDGFSVGGPGGRIEVLEVAFEGGPKVAATAFAREHGLAVGAILGE